MSFLFEYGKELEGRVDHEELLTHKLMRRGPTTHYFGKVNQDLQVAM